MDSIDFKYEVNEKPESKKEHFALSFQHVFAMFGSTILVPTLIGIDVATALFAAGLGTLTYTTVTQKKVPVFIGSSFAYIAILTDLNKSSGPSGVGFAVMCVGIMYMLISLLIKLVGTNWIDKILPPIVVGPLIIVIGLSLAPVAITNAGFASGAYNFKSMIVALSALLCTTFSLLKGKKIVSMLPIIFGIMGGYFVALCLGMIDVSVIMKDGIFNIPQFHVPFISYQPTFDLGIVLSLIPLILVTISEHIGDHTVSSSMMGKNFLKDPGLKRTILGDGLATFFAGFLGGPVNTTYAENTGVIMLTRVASISVIRGAAIVSMCLAFIAPVVNFINTIPVAVMGGISIVLFGMIAQNGIRILITANLDFTHARNMIICAIILVFGLGGAELNFVIGGVTFSFSKMALSALFGIIFHLILPNKEVAYGQKK